MGDIYDAVHLEQNAAELSKAIDDLVDLSVKVTRRSELYREDTDEWLQNVKNEKRKMEEIQSMLNKLNIHGFGINKLNDRKQLNKKVIDNLKAANNLTVEGNACPKSIRSLLTEIAFGQPREFSRAEIKSITSNLSESNMIQSDPFGKVYKGMCNGKQLSVKVLADKDVSQGRFKSEVTVLINTSHRHLSKIYGYCFERDIIALVYEYMENRSFAELLFQKTHAIEWDKCYDIAIKTGKAIAYLHEGCEDQIIHRDINASNVFLDKNDSPKVANFGVAKLIKEGRTHVTLTNHRGIPGYFPPEMWIPSSRITCACDVYSFGIMLFEILGRESLLGKKVTKEGAIWFPEHVWNKYKSDGLDDILEECGINEKDKIKARTLAKVALWCIHHAPKERPSMSNLVKILEMEIPVKNRITDPFLKHYRSPNKSSSVGEER